MDNAQDLLKRKYGPGAINTYDLSSPLLSQVKKDFSLEGERFEEYIPLSKGGGRGTTSDGTVPTANPWKMDKAYFQSVEHLSSVKLKRTLMYASKGEGAWVDAQAEQVKRGVILFRDNTERQIMGNADGVLGTIKAASAITDNGSGNYTFYLTASTFIEAHFEEGDLVNIGSGSTDLFEIEELDPDEENDYASPTLTVQRKTGSAVPAAGDSIFMQGSENNDMYGARAIVKATSGSLYDVPVQRRWRGFYMSSVGVGISCRLIDKLILGIHQRCGQAPDLLITSYTQWRLLKDTLVHLKRFNETKVAPRFNMPKFQKQLMEAANAGRLGFNAIVYDGPFGSAYIMISKYCRRDEFWAFNRNYMALKHMRGFGWHDEDGTVWLREVGKTNYEARYGGDMQFWMPPPFHGVIDGLTTS
jgi:hypothetical protein